MSTERLDIQTDDGSTYWRCQGCGTRWRDSKLVAAAFSGPPPCPKCKPDERTDRTQPMGLVRMVDVRDIRPENTVSIELRALRETLVSTGTSEADPATVVLERAADEIDRLHAENCLLKQQTAEKMRQAIERMGLGDQLRAAQGGPCSHEQ